MKTFVTKLTVVAFFICLLPKTTYGQTSILDTLRTGTIKAQINILEKKTLIYDNYRAVREDYFQLFTQNVLDSLSKGKNKIQLLENTKLNLNIRIDSLSNVLNTTSTELKETARTKNSIKIFGANINKVAYNSIVWSIIGILALILIIGLGIYYNCLSSTNSTKQEHENLLKEFEEYKQKTRVEREKMNVEHFREIQKLKGLK